MELYVYYNNEKCGFINIYEEENYIVLDVSTDIISLDITRVFLENEDENILLGVLIPKNNKYTLKKRIPKPYFQKMQVNENTYAYIKNDNKKEIQDKNLSKSNFEKVINYRDFDIYMYEYSSEKEFKFDFCFSLCNIMKIDDKKYITIKTDKNGKIVV